MPFNPNVPSTSFGNWVRTGSATYVPPELTRVGRRDAQIAKLEADLAKANEKAAKEKEKKDAARAIARAERKQRGASTEDKRVDAPSEKKKVDAPKEEKKVHLAKRTKVDAPKEKKNMVNAATSPIKSEGTKKSSYDAWKKEREGLQDRLFQFKANSKKAAKTTAAKAEAPEEASKKKAVEEAVAKKEADKAEAAKKKTADEEKAKKMTLAESISAVKEKNERTVLKKGRYCCDCGQRNHEGDCNEFAAANANNRSVTNNYYILPKPQELAGSLIKSPKGTTKADFQAKALEEFTASPGGRVKFTKEQDAKLLSLKKAGKDARDVSRELGMPKLDVVDRWRELSIMKSRTAQDEAFANESVLPEGDEVIGEATDVKVKDGVATLTFKMYDTATDKNDGGNKDKKQKKVSNYKKPTSEDDKDEPAGHSDNKADAKKNSNGNVNFPVYRTRTGQPTSYVPVSYASTVPLRGGARRLYPDDNFSIKDLEILKEIECRYRELQWHEVAAKFYNKTSRMMDPNVIKAKFSGGKEVQDDGNQPDTLNVRVNLN